MLYKILSWFILSLSIFFNLDATVEFDIFPLSIPSHQLSTFKNSLVKFDDHSDVVGLRYNEKSTQQELLLYDAKEGLKSIPMPMLGQIEPVMINDNHILVGYRIEDGPLGFKNKLVVYDVNNSKMIDTSNNPDLEMLYSFKTIGISNDAHIVGENDRDDNSFFYYVDQDQLSYDLKDNIMGMNTQGQIIGWEDSHARWDSPEVQAWYYDPSSGYTDLYFYPFNIFQNGYVAGNDNDGFGYIWKPEYGLIQLDISEDGFPFVEGVNQDGQAVGFINSEEGWRAFMFDRKSQSSIDLGDLGGFQSLAFGINDLSQVVGRSRNNPQSCEFKAFIWDATHGMRSLSELIPSDSGWDTLEDASSINNHGYILGTGIYKGREQTFLLVPRK